MKNVLEALSQGWHKIFGILRSLWPLKRDEPITCWVHVQTEEDPEVVEFLGESRYIPVGYEGTLYRGYLRNSKGEPHYGPWLTNRRDARTWMIAFALQKGWKVIDEKESLLSKREFRELRSWFKQKGKEWEEIKKGVRNTHARIVQDPAPRSRYTYVSDGYRITGTRQ